MGLGLEGERDLDELLSTQNTFGFYSELLLKAGSLDLFQDNGQRLGLRLVKHCFSFSLVVLPHQHSALCLLTRCSISVAIAGELSCRGHRIFHWVAWGQ